MVHRTRRQLPTDFKGLYVDHPPSIGNDVSAFIALAIRYTEGQTSDVHRYAVQHLMLKFSGDADMDAWAREQKLFPWVAVAAQLKVSDTLPLRCRMVTSVQFTT